MDLELLVLVMLLMSDRGGRSQMDATLLRCTRLVSVDYHARVCPVVMHIVTVQVLGVMASGLQRARVLLTMHRSSLKT